MTQKDVIIRWLSIQDDWIPSFKLRGISTPFGFIGSQGDRRCRELFEAGKIQRKLIGKYVYYKVEPKPMRIYKVEGMDKIIKLSY